MRYGALDDRTALRLGEPLFQVGWSSGGHEFERIRTGVILEGGGAAIGDIGADELVFVSPEGEMVSVLGGPGEGPTEIGTLMSVNRLSGDTVVVEDDGNRRMSVFHSGGFVRSHRVVSGPSSFDLHSLGSVGDVLVMTTSSYQPDIEEEWLVAPLVRHQVATERWDTVVVYDFVMSFSFDEVVSPMRPYGSAAVAGEDLLVVRSDRAEVRRFDASGSLRQIVRWEGEERAPTDSLWNVYADYRRSRNTTRSEEEMDALLRELREAVVGPLPYMGSVLGAANGDAWVSEYPMDYRYPAAYRVFSRDGEWQGWVRMPPRFQVLDIRGDLVLGIQRDAFDVEAATMLPIER